MSDYDEARATASRNAWNAAENYVTIRKEYKKIPFMTRLFKKRMTEAERELLKRYLDAKFQFHVASDISIMMNGY